MWKRGEIPGYQLSTGTVSVEQPDQSGTPTRRVAIYARVTNSANNKKKLETQAKQIVTWCNAHGWSVAHIVKECGSDINDQRPRFLALLADPTISHIVVEHKDRASHFGVVYIQTLLAFQGREPAVNGRNATEDDLMG